MPLIVWHILTSPRNHLLPNQTRRQHIEKCWRSRDILRFLFIPPSAVCCVLPLIRRRDIIHMRRRFRHRSKIVGSFHLFFFLSRAEPRSLDWTTWSFLPSAQCAPGMSRCLLRRNVWLLSGCHTFVSWGKEKNHPFPLPSIHPSASKFFFLLFSFDVFHPSYPPAPCYRYRRSQRKK